MEEREQKNTETIKMVERALQVLDLLRTSKSPLGVNEIAKTCKLNPSTTFRILKTLELSGWVFQLNDSRYITGQKISFVTERNNLYIALQDVASLIMQHYTNEYNMAMNLLIRKGTSCIILQQSRTNKIVDYVPPIYSELPIYACAGGKVFLSELPISHAEAIIEASNLVPLTSHTITDPNLFWQELRITAKRGYAFDNHESTEGGSCVAVPVRDIEGTVIAALSFSEFIGVEDVSELEKYVPALKEASSWITRSLFSFGPQGKFMEIQ